MIQTLRRFPDLWVLGALLAVLVSLGYFVTGPLTGDDDYVIHNLASLLAAHALLKLREHVTVVRRLLFVAAAVAAPLSDEAAVAIPLLLVGLDWLWPNKGTRRRPTDGWATLSVLAAYPVYVAVSVWNRTGTTLTDASYRAGPVELVEMVRADLANYIVKVLPMPPYGPDPNAAIGSWLGFAVIASIVAAPFPKKRRARRLETPRSGRGTEPALQRTYVARC